MSQLITYLSTDSSGGALLFCRDKGEREKDDFKAVSSNDYQTKASMQEAIKLEGNSQEGEGNKGKW